MRCPKLRIEALLPGVMVFAGGAVGKSLGHEVGACVNGIAVKPL